MYHLFSTFTEVFFIINYYNTIIFYSLIHKSCEIHRNKNRTLYSCGCKTIPGAIFPGSKSSKSLSAGSLIVAICISEDKNKKIRDFAKTSPMQLLFPNPNAANLK